MTIDITNADHELLDQYLTLILTRVKEGHQTVKDAVLEIVEPFSLVAKDMGSFRTYMRAHIDGDE